MQYMVIFRSLEGKPGYHHADVLDEAVSFVENLRNTEQVTDARIFKMDEVQISFKTYYRVEVAGPGPVEALVTAPAAVEPTAPWPPAALVDAAPVDFGTEFAPAPATEAAEPAPEPELEPVHAFATDAPAAPPWSTVTESVPEPAVASAPSSRFGLFGRG